MGPGSHQSDEERAGVCSQCSCSSEGKKRHFVFNAHLGAERGGGAGKEGGEEADVCVSLSQPSLRG